MSELIIKDENGKRNFKIECGELLLGRSEECAVILKAQAVSRKHSRLFKEGPFYYIQDLNSTNGTFVNGVKISEKTPLAHRDTIGAGSARIDFYDAEGAMLEDTAIRLAGDFHNAPQGSGDDLKSAVDKIFSGISSVREKLEALNSRIPDTTSGTKALKNTLNIISDDISGIIENNDIYGLISAAAENKTSFTDGPVAGNGPSTAPDRPAPPEEAISVQALKNDSAKQYCLVIEQINDIIVKVEDYKKASKFILSVAMKIVDTNRGFIVVKDPTIGSIMPFVSEISSNEFAESSPSMLVAKYAIDKSETIIVADPMLDERFMGMSESIVSGIIKSVICLPLIKNGVCLGAIYMDNTMHKKNFSAGDKEFIETLGGKISVLLEKSGLFGDLIDEYERVEEKDVRIAAYLEEFKTIGPKFLIEGVINEADAEKTTRLIKLEAKSPVLCMLDGGIASMKSLEPVFIKNGALRVNLNERRVTSSLAAAIPHDYSLARVALIFERTMKKEIMVAMADPFDKLTIDEIEKYSGCKAEVFYCEKDEIVKALKQFE